MVLMSCDKVVEEGMKIVKVCHEIQAVLNPYDRREILNLMVLVNSKRPRYTAAGYFVLNRCSLFALLSVITTYFIILVQFHQSSYVNQEKLPA